MFSIVANSCSYVPPVISLLTTLTIVSVVAALYYYIMKRALEHELKAEKEKAASSLRNDSARCDKPPLVLPRPVPAHALSMPTNVSAPESDGVYATDEYDHEYDYVQPQPLAAGYVNNYRSYVPMSHPQDGKFPEQGSRASFQSRQYQELEGYDSPKAYDVPDNPVNDFIPV